MTVQFDAEDFIPATNQVPSMSGMPAMARPANHDPELRYRRPVSRQPPAIRW